MSESLFDDIKLSQEQKDILTSVIHFSKEVTEMAKMDGIDPEIVILSSMSLFVSSIEKLYNTDSKDDIEAARGYVVGMLHELSVILEEVGDSSIQLGIKNDIDDQGGAMFG